MTRALATFVVLTALTLGAAGCLPEPEEGPTWSGEIRPMLIAHCGRCHDGTGWSEAAIRSMTNLVPEAPSMLVVGLALSRVDPKELKENKMPRMPLPPAEPLKDWQIDMLKAWLEYQKP